MNPLVQQIKEHKTTMEKRLETLRRISESRDTLEARIKELETLLRDTKTQIDILQQLNHALNTPLAAPVPRATEEQRTQAAEAAV